jgi:hypothetical protein
MGNLGDAKAVGERVSELRIHYGPGYRVYYKQRGSELVILLAGGDQGAPVPGYKNRTASCQEPYRLFLPLKKTKTTRYDVAEHLKTPEEMAVYLEACFEEGGNDAGFIAKALGDIARTKGMTQVARDA